MDVGIDRIIIIGVWSIACPWEFISIPYVLQTYTFVIKSIYLLNHAFDR